MTTMAITPRWLAVVLLTLGACANSVGTSDGAVDAGARDVVICTGICTTDMPCTNGTRQTGNGRCDSGTFICDRVACSPDDGGVHD